jgi:hypothetical protein
MKVTITTGANIGKSAMSILNEFKDFASSMRFFFDDNAHPSYGRHKMWTNRELAEILSSGMADNSIFGKGSIEVPARPMFEQYFEANGETLQTMINDKVRRIVSKQGSGMYGQTRVASNLKNELAETIRNDIVDWVKDGNVSPPNSPYTLQRKLGSAPWVNHGDLIESLRVEVVSGNRSEGVFF